MTSELLCNQKKKKPRCKSNARSNLIASWLWALAVLCFGQTWWQRAPALFLAFASASESFWTWWEQSVFPGVGGWLKCVGSNATADQSRFCRWSATEMSDQPGDGVSACGQRCSAAMMLTSLWSSTTLSNVSMVLRMPIAVTALSSPPSSSGPVWITWLNVIACQRVDKETIMIVSVDFTHSASRLKVFNIKYKELVKSY